MNVNEYNAKEARGERSHSPIMLDGKKKEETS